MGSPPSRGHRRSAPSTPFSRPAFERELRRRAVSAIEAGIAARMATEARAPVDTGALEEHPPPLTS